MILSALRATLLVAACVTASSALAQDDPSKFPQRTIKLVVPYAPGGGTDILARMAAHEIQEALGQPTIVENKPGAAAIVGTEMVARSKPDGYTLLVAPSGPLVMNPVLKKSLPYSAEKDFVPISVIGRLPLFVTINASMPQKTMKDFVAYAKANPDKMSYASSAPLSILATELFKQKTGIQAVMVPYKSSGESATAVLAGHVTMVIADVPPVAGLIKDGKLRALAYTDTQRNSEFPDVPTTAEAGLEGTEIATLVGLVAPAGTPMPIVRKIQDVLIKMVKKPDVRKKFVPIGVEPVGSTSEQYAAAIKADLARWEQVATKAGIQKE